MLNSPLVKCLTVKSRKDSKPRDWVLGWSYRFEIWPALILFKPVNILWLTVKYWFFYDRAVDLCNVYDKMSLFLTNVISIYRALVPMTRRTVDISDQWSFWSIEHSDQWELHSRKKTMCAVTYPYLNISKIKLIKRSLSNYLLSIITGVAKHGTVHGCCSISLV